ncbi:hypothetical protein CEXT_258761 [Caerostris extrusa]|uniref:Uncharacterized protein n=1 Tax=Caerostris extrusa TaxID=172846 RepID=A0AAV4XD94_CAEEX|nr:hypothetical protein CEXT_258761 [Caerostris extrusa]
MPIATAIIVSAYKNWNIEKFSCVKYLVVVSRAVTTSTFAQSHLLLMTLMNVYTKFQDIEVPDVTNINHANSSRKLRFSQVLKPDQESTAQTHAPVSTMKDSQ